MAFSLSDRTPPNLLAIPAKAGIHTLRGSMPFAYQGPAVELPAIQRALAAVMDPLAGANLLQRRAVHHATLRDGRARVVLELAPGMLRQPMVKDLEAELLDHLQGRWRIEVLVVDPPNPRRPRRAVPA